MSSCSRREWLGRVSLHARSVETALRCCRTCGTSCLFVFLGVTPVCPLRVPRSAGLSVPPERPVITYPLFANPPPSERAVLQPSWMGFIHINRHRFCCCLASPPRPCRSSLSPPLWAHLPSLPGSICVFRSLSDTRSRCQRNPPALPFRVLLSGRKSHHRFIYKSHHIIFLSITFPLGISLHLCIASLPPSSLCVCFLYSCFCVFVCIISALSSSLPTPTPPHPGPVSESLQVSQASGSFTCVKMF